MSSAPAAMDYELDEESGVTLQLRPTDEGVTVSVYRRGDDGPEEVYVSLDETRDFYQSNQKRRVLANKVEEKLPKTVNREGVLTELDTFLSELNFGLDDTTKSKLQAPVVQQLREETQEVKFIPGETLIIRVALARDGMEKTIQFSSGEWTAPNPKPLQDRYLDEFLETLDLSADQWKDLREYWEEQKEIGEPEALTQRERAFNDVVNRLKSDAVRVYSEKDKMTDPEAYKNAWYDEGNQMGDAKVPDGETVVWVRSEALREVLEDGSYGGDYIGELSQVLKEKGATFAKSREKSFGYVYPFLPKYVGVTDPEKHVRYADETGVDI